MIGIVVQPIQRLVENDMVRKTWTPSAMSTEQEYRFNVFGTLVAITGIPGAWQPWYLGVEGKRRPADFIVPSDLAAHELREYLADLFHENATPRNMDVTRLP